MIETPIFGADKKTRKHLLRLAQANRRKARRLASKAAQEEREKNASDERQRTKSKKRVSRMDEMQGVAARRIRSFEIHPTAIGAAMLAEMLTNPNVSAQNRATAAGILLKRANGDFTHNRKKRRGRKS